MRRFLIALLCIACATGVMATPARRGLWRSLTLTDGTTVQAELRGDAFCHFYQDAEGVRYTRVPGSDTYQPADMATLHARAYQRRKAPAQAATRRAPRRITIGSEHAPLTGTHHELIIMVNFSNCAFEATHTQELYNRIVNEEGFVDMSLGFYDGSVRDYFLAQSDGLFTLEFDIVGPVTLPHPYSYYGRNDSRYDQDEAPERMIIDAVKAVDDDVDFSRYDNDGDGYVDQVFVLYAGKNESAGGDANTVWPHKYNISYSSINNYRPLSQDGVLIDDYACSSELTWTGMEQVSATQYEYTFGLAGIGAICHEFSHCLGLPDVYDTAYENYGMNTWSIMDAGEWNGIECPGYTPAAYTAYERMYCGWRQPTELRTDTIIRGMKPITRGGETFIIRNQAHPDEYYLLENRQLDGWDRALDAIDDQQLLGLLVTHVDFDATIWEYNEVNCTNSTRGQTGNTHQRLHVVAADNSYQSEKTDPVTHYDYYDYADVQGDAYPYQGNDSLTNTSIPRANLYNINTDGTRLLGVGITNIRQNADGTIDFDFRASAGTAPYTPDEVYFYESFDQCAGTGGNDGLWGGSASVAAASLRADNEGWSTQSAFGADKAARFGASRGVTTAQTPEFAINGQAVITFLAAPWEGDGTDLYISAYSDDDEAATFTIAQNHFTMTPGQWTECTTTVTGYGKLHLRFRPTRRFFLDEVRVQAPTAGDAVPGLTPDATPAAAADGPVYDLAGRRIQAGSRTHGVSVSNGHKAVR